MVDAGFSSADRGFKRFHLWRAAACAAVAFGLFIPAHWALLAAATCAVSTLTHLHGALYFS